MTSNGDIDAARFRRSRQDGPEHGDAARRAAATQIVAFDRSAEAVARAAAAGARGVDSLEALVAALDAAARRLGDGARPASRPNRRSPALGQLLAAGDIDHRRRQHQLSRRRAARARRSRPSGIALRRRRHERRHLGAEEGYCLMVGGDAEVCRAARADLPDAGAAGRLSARRRPRRRPLREDDPQRHRVRADAGLRRRLRADARQRLQDRRSARVAALWMHGSVVRSWLLELTARALGGRPDLAGARRLRRRLGRRTLDAAGRRSTAACRCRCSPRRCSPASARATTIRSASGCSRRCATSSAATR